MLRHDKKSLKNKNELNYFDLDCTSASSLDRLVWQLCCVCVGRFILNNKTFLTKLLKNIFIIKCFLII